MPEITVAITTHNLEKYLLTCIRELMSQTFQDFEILIYDDYSTDMTRALIQDLLIQYPDKIKAVFGSIPLGAPARARNAVLDCGKINGKWIVFLDGDDDIEPDFLSSLYGAAMLNSADISLCAYDRFEDETGHVLCREMTGVPDIIELNDQCRIDLAFVNTSLWNKLIRVDRIGSVRFPDFQVGEDASFLLALYMNCNKICCVEDILIHYRVRSTSVISNTNEQNIYQFAEELLRLQRLTDQKWMRDNISLASMIHIGIAMPIRIYNNPNANLDRVERWIREHFKTEYQWFKKAKWKRLSHMLRYGMKGLGILGALFMHRVHSFKLFIWLYSFITGKLHIDIKF